MMPSFIAISLALPFGLVAYVCSGDLARIWSMTDQIEPEAVGARLGRKE